MARPTAISSRANAGKVAGIDAVCRGEREQHLALGERFHDY
jgi:hypothetical protein